MSKVDIYTYFTGEQMRCLLIDSKKGVAGMLKHLENQYPQDIQELIFAVADRFPQFVAEDRVYKSGPRKGQRKVVFFNIDRDISSTVAQELTGCSDLSEFVRASDYMKKSMVETVLTPPESSPQYSKHWIKTFLEQDTDFPNLRDHFRKMTIKNVSRARKIVDNWIIENKPDMNELMTWDGKKFNDWYFSQSK